MCVCVYECVRFVLCGCVYVWVLYCAGVCMCGFSKVSLCVCVDFVKFVFFYYVCLAVWVL